MANLHKHASKELRADYLSDATKLRVLAAKLVKPAHVCSHNESAGAARACEVAPLDGAGLVALLERWVALGHIIVDESAKNRGVNVTAVIESYSTQLDQWMTWRCGELRALLEKLARKLGKVGCVVAGCPRVAGKLSAFATTRTHLSAHAWSYRAADVKTLSKSALSTYALIYPRLRPACRRREARAAA